MRAVWSGFLSLLIYCLLFGVAAIALTAVKWILVLTFNTLSSEGPAKNLRQLLSFPLVALLSRERYARDGDCSSARQLAILLIATTGILSWVTQGFWIAIACTALFLVGLLLSSRAEGNSVRSNLM